MVRPGPRGTADTKEVSWNGVLFPQPPSYLFITYQKDPTYTTYNNPFRNGANLVAPAAAANNAPKFGTGVSAVFDNAAATNVGVSLDFLGPYTQATVFNQELAARNIAMAQDAQATILRVELVIQSAVGSFAFRDNVDSELFLQDRDRLFRTHIRNCHSSYCDAGRGVWADKESCLLLSTSDYLIGLETSSGTVFPITLDLKVEFANRSTHSGGACFTTGVGVKGKMQFENIIIGEPTLVGLFHQNVMSIAASSSVLSSQAFSQATTAAALQSS